MGPVAGRLYIVVMDMPRDILDRIREVVGPRGWIDAPADMAPYLEEERGSYHGNCRAVVRPASTAEVARVVALCAGAGIPVFPQGGNTGLVGGAVPEGGIVVSTARLDKVRQVDRLNHTITVEAGVILADVHKAAAEVGAMFPLSLGAEGSCHIGGNLATNAGGVAVLRYGNTRDLVLGIEVVLPDGRVWNGLKGLRKDNTGYDLKHLFIGAEGTLGIITAAVLKLYPRPKRRVVGLAAAENLDHVLALFERALDNLGATLTAFEMIPRIGMEFGTAHIPGVIDPFEAPHPCYALIRVSSTRADARPQEDLENLLAQAFEDGIVADAVIAHNEAQTAELWHIRESIPEAQKHEGASIKHDVSVPVSRLADFVAEASRLVAAECPGVRVVPFGHVGDGNVHFNLSQPPGMDRQAFLDMRPALNRLVHDLALGMGGSFSAEHGIGLLKREEMVRYKSEVELDLMRRVKKALDPGGIMNPGKVIPTE